MINHIDLHKLIKVPSLFENDEKTLLEIAQKPVSNLSDKSLNIYTRCDCDDGVYADDYAIKNHKITRFVCAGCKNWNISVVY